LLSDTTQRPRDIPHDVLSQLGTLFVQRLTNKQDRDTVESACGDLDRGAAQFIPMLGPGEAVVIGPDLPAPVPVFVHPPTSPPDSRGPTYQGFWKMRQKSRVVPAPDLPSEHTQNNQAFVEPAIAEDTLSKVIS
jgi:DNA helicase HerA-like ATPase